MAQQATALTDELLRALKMLWGEVQAANDEECQAQLSLAEIEQIEQAIARAGLD